MKVAIVTFDGFNELDSFIALGLLNRVLPSGDEHRPFAKWRGILQSNRLVVVRLVIADEIHVGLEAE